MTRKEFFTKLHQDLANKYGLKPRHVGIIRSLIIGQKLSKQDIIGIIQKKPNQEREKSHTSRVGRRRETKQFYFDMLKFMETANDKTWSEIIQKTTYDK